VCVSKLFLPAEVTPGKANNCFSLQGKRWTSCCATRHLLKSTQLQRLTSNPHVLFLSFTSLLLRVLRVKDQTY